MPSDAMCILLQRRRSSITQHNLLDICNSLLLHLVSMFAGCMIPLRRSQRKQKKMADPTLPSTRSQLPLAMAKMLSNGKLYLLASFTDGSQHRVYKTRLRRTATPTPRASRSSSREATAKVSTALGMEILMVRKSSARAGSAPRCRGRVRRLGFANAARWPFCC